VPEDASLDAFDSESADAESADSASAQQSDGEELLTTDPAVSTFDWSPEGGECADCGESVERRWRADGERGGELVGADCKEW
jgi:hypothetical protein